MSHHLHQREQKGLHLPPSPKTNKKYIRDHRLKWIIKSQLTKLLVRLRNMYKRGDVLCHRNGLEGLWMDCILIWDPSKYFPPLGRRVTYTGLLPVLLPKHSEKVSNLFIRPLACSTGLIPSNSLVSNHVNTLANIASSQLLICLSLTSLHECDIEHNPLKFKQSLIIEEFPTKLDGLILSCGVDPVRSYISITPTLPPMLILFI